MALLYIHFGSLDIPVFSRFGENKDEDSYFFQRLLELQKLCSIKKEEKSFTKSYHKRHLPKCPSKNSDPPVQNNFYTYGDSEEKNGEINFPMILNEVRKKIQILLFLKKFLRKNQGTMRMTVS